MKMQANDYYRGENLRLKAKLRVKDGAIANLKNDVKMWKKNYYELLAKYENAMEEIALNAHKAIEIAKN